MSFSNWMESRVMSHIFSKTTYTPQTIYVGLCINNPGEGATGGSCNELPSANGYARVQTSAGTWSYASGGLLVNASEIIFPVAIANWGWVRAFVLVNHPTRGSGNVLLYSVLNVQRNIVAYNKPSFSVGTLRVILG